MDVEESAKRKRSEEPEDALPVAKRLEPTQPSPQDCRRALAELYAAYDALHRMGTAATDTSAAQAHFSVLLRAAQGTAPSRRLAAKLLPKFAPRFPPFMADAMEALQCLGALTLDENDAATAKTTRFDALAGMRLVVLSLTAPPSANGRPATTPPASIAVADATLRFALGQLAALPGAVEAAEACLQSLAAAAESEAAALWRVAEAAFQASPRSVLNGVLRLTNKENEEGNGNAAGPQLAPLAAAFLHHYILGAAAAEKEEGNEDSGMADAKEVAAPKENGTATTDADADAKTVPRLVAAFKAQHCTSGDRHWASRQLKELLRNPSFSEAAPAAARRAAEAAAAAMAAPSGRQDASLSCPGSSKRARTAVGEQGGGRRRSSPSSPSRGRDGTRDSRERGDGRARPRAVPPPAAEGSPSELEDGELDEGEIPSNGGNVNGRPSGNLTGTQLSSRSAPSKAPLLPVPIKGPIALVAPCLYLAGLRRGGGGSSGGLLDRQAKDHCRRFGDVLSAVLPPGPPGNAALVSFATMRDATRCYQAIADQPAPFSADGRLRVQFCGTTLAPTAASPQHDTTHVWVADITTPGDETALLRCLNRGGGGGAGPVEHVARIAGRRPGLLLTFSTPAAARSAEETLRREWPRFGGGGGGRAGDQGPHGTSSSPGAAAGRGGSDGGGGGGSMGRRSMPPPEAYNKSLWVGQVPLGPHSERELVSAFARFGDIMGHRVIRHSSCAFINYYNVDAAAEARRRMDGARVAGSTLVVEFKNEKQYWAAQGGRGRYEPPPLPLGGGGPMRGGRGGVSPPPRRDMMIGNHANGGTMPSSPFAGAGGGGGDFNSSGGPRGASPASSRPRRRRSRSPVPLKQPKPAAEAAGTPPVPRQPSGLGPLQQQPAATPTPPLVPRPGRGAAPWRGMIAKGRQPQAEVVCPDGPFPPASGWAAAEPAAWPAALDVQQRTHVDYVCATLFPSLSPENRAVLRLLPAPGQPDGEARLAAFANYLRGKQRAGVVPLGPGPQPGAPRRALYLIPASEEACRALGVAWPPAPGESLIALVAPAGDAVAGG